MFASFSRLRPHSSSFGRSVVSSFQIIKKQPRKTQWREAMPRSHKTERPTACACVALMKARYNPFAAASAHRQLPGRCRCWRSSGGFAVVLLRCSPTGALIIGGRAVGCRLQLSGALLLSLLNVSCCVAHKVQGCAFRTTPSSIATSVLLRRDVSGLKATAKLDAVREH